MLFDPDVIGGEDRAGGEHESEKREAGPRQAVRRTAGERRQERNGNGGIEGVALGEAELAGRIAEPLKDPHRREDDGRRDGDPKRPQAQGGGHDDLGGGHQKTLIAITKPATTSATNPASAAAKFRSSAVRNGSPNQCSTPATRKNRAPRVKTDKATNRGKL